jgi:hypothetical protein
MLASTTEQSTIGANPNLLCAYRAFATFCAGLTGRLYLNEEYFMSTPSRPKMHLPPVAIEHWISAIAEEVRRQEQFASVVNAAPDAQWPDDYDPNDLAMYRGFLEWLRSVKSTGAEVEDPRAGPISSAMIFLLHYVRVHCAQISESELGTLFRTYAEFVALSCALDLPGQLEQRTSRADAVAIAVAT